MLDVLTVGQDPNTVRVNGHKLTCVSQCVCHTPWDPVHAMPSPYTARLYDNVVDLDLNFRN